MTVKELIAELKKLENDGYGDNEVLSAEGDAVYSITESLNKKKIIIYFDD